LGAEFQKNGQRNGSTRFERAKPVVTGSLRAQAAQRLESACGNDHVSISGGRFRRRRERPKSAIRGKQSWGRRHGVDGPGAHHFPLASLVDSCHNWNTACHLGASQHYWKANTSVFQQTVFCSRVSPLTETVGGKLRLLKRREARFELHVLFFAAQLPRKKAIKPVPAMRPGNGDLCPEGVSVCRPSLRETLPHLDTKAAVRLCLR
jgi:hypothetical protein